MQARGHASFCGLLVLQKEKCANPNTFTNANTNPIPNTTNPNQIHTPTNPKLQARILPFAYYNTGSSTWYIQQVSVKADRTTHSLDHKGPD